LLNNKSYTYFNPSGWSSSISLAKLKHTAAITNSTNPKQTIPDKINSINVF